MPKIIDLTGKKFCRLTVKEKHGSRNGRPMWLCQCECGNITIVKGSYLANGDTKSCGCLKKEPRIKTHRMSKTPEYVAWCSIKCRCYNKNQEKYKNYGDRGIKVCDRWKHSFINFYSDMGKRPSAAHSIDRINNDDSYSPDNCKWSTKVEQANNTRSNNTIEINGEFNTLAQWCRFHNINYSAVQMRIRRGWSEIKAITTPISR